MSLIKNNALVGASGQGGVYTIDRSLRLRSSASAYLSRTPASAGNRKTWTYSIWFKYAGIGTQQMLGGAGSSGNETYISFNSTGELQFRQLNSSTQTMLLQTSQVFRDPSAWYHIVIEVDTTQATSSDRIKIYINGSQVTAFSTASYYSLNYDSHINNNVAHYFGRRPSSGSLYFDGYLTEINFVDGQALDPTYFGEYNSDTGVWQPIKYTGTYGTNGFYLNFSDNSTTTTLGYDTSGNSNNWTANNISVTSGATYDSMTDVPTLTSEDAANYATWNPLDKDNGISSVTNGNLKVVTNGSNGSIKSTIAFPSGKWYWEVTSDSVNSGGTQVIGIMPQSQPPTNNMSDSGKLGYALDASYTDRKFDNGAATSYGSYTQGNGVVYMLAFDQDAGKLWYGVNGTWLASGAPATGSNPSSSSISTSTAYCAAVSDNTVSGTFTANFGQRPFAYTPPTDFKSLNTYNLPDSTIEDGSEYFNTVTYTGNGSSQTVTGFGFNPDMVWHKGRSVAYSHSLVDVLRGNSNVLLSNTTDAEQNPGAQLDLATDGANVTYRAANLANNQSSATYVIWGWKANGSGVTNNEGTIESTVSANTTAGFSIVTYTGTGANATVGHGLGVAPKMVIVKNRDDGAQVWTVWFTGFGSTEYIVLNTTAAKTTSAGVWNSTVPTSTVFSVGTGNSTNKSTNEIVAYCFADVEGFSKFGSYTGNGSTDGAFVYLGFRPRLILIKRTNSTGNWQMWELNPVGTYNVVNNLLYANLANAETSASATGDALSNGFKLRQADNDNNASGSTYIYMAFAENPFKNSLAR